MLSKVVEGLKERLVDSSDVTSDTISDRDIILCVNNDDISILILCPDNEYIRRKSITAKPKNTVDESVENCFDNMEIAIKESREDGYSIYIMEIGDLIELLNYGVKPSARVFW
jgi:predicted secreted protein